MTTDSAPSPAAGGGESPDFVIVGAMKSGTTSLAEYLMAHPQAWLPPGKELSFFDRNWERGLDWYRSQFAGAGDAVACGEATPTYLSSPAVPERLAQVAGHAKLIAVLRDPVERAYSHYWHERQRKGREHRSFEQAVADELAEGLEAPDDRFDPDHLTGVGYLARGRYAEQLERLCEHMPRASLLVLFLDDLETDPTGTFAEVCRWIGIDPSIVPDNVGGVANAYVEQRAPRLSGFMTRHRLWRLVPRRLMPRLGRALVRTDTAYPAMAEHTRAELERYFAPHNARLAEWLGRDLPRWDGSRPATPAAPRRSADARVQQWQRR